MMQRLLRATILPFVVAVAIPAKGKSRFLYGFKLNTVWRVKLHQSRSHQ